MLLSRRKFLEATVGLVALDVRAGDELNANEFKPVRETPLKASYWGTQFYDE